MPGNSVNRKLTAVLYADIADYSRLTQNDEAVSLEMVSKPDLRVPGKE
jgi:class 3 adenylate cyclase